MAALRKSNKLSSHALLQPLKLRILASLDKLSDRDTYHIALQELDLLSDQISQRPPNRAESAVALPLLLSCLYETLSSMSADHQKAAVKKECVKMLGRLASLHEDKLSPHLPKIIAHLVKRLGDPDSNVRDACVDTMGILSAKVSPRRQGTSKNKNREEEEEEEEQEVDGSTSLAFFVNPLFNVLNIENESRSMQIGASMCLARVISRFRPHPPQSSLQRSCDRVIKLLNNPRFYAKAALLPAIANIIQAGGASSYKYLSRIITCVRECLKSNDWATRKAAAETLLDISTTSHNHASLSSFKPLILGALEHCRFDKVKPVRDMVIQTLQVWKNMGPENAVLDHLEIEVDVHDMGQNNLDNGMSGIDCMGLSHARLNTMEGSHVKMTNITSDKPQSVGAQKQVPKGSVQVSFTSSSFSLSSSSSSSSSSASLSSSCIDSSSQIEEGDEIGSSWSLVEGTCPYDDNSTNSIVDFHEVSNAKEHDSGLIIRRQLAHIERQQTSILKLLQKLMERSDETFIKLDGRIGVIESCMGR